MKVAVVALVLMFVLGSGYLLLPVPNFPDPPLDSLQSVEPADTESLYRRSYYTNLTRDEIMTHYVNKFAHPLQFKLNHPPEDAAVLIRDQTRSNFLEEIVHPLKQSLYVNGFVPEKPQDTIVRNGQVYTTKLTVRYVPSHPVARITVWALTLIGLTILIKEYRHV